MFGFSAALAVTTNIVMTNANQEPRMASLNCITELSFVWALGRPTLHQFDVLLYRSVSLGISSVSVYLEFHFYGIDFGRFWARVIRLFHPHHKSGPQVEKRTLMLRHISQIDRFVRVGFDIIEFFGCPLRCEE